MSETAAAIGFRAAPAVFAGRCPRAAARTRTRYDLIASIDAYDFWRAGKLAKQLEALAADPDQKLVGSLRLVHPRNPSLDRG